MPILLDMETSHSHRRRPLTVFLASAALLGLLCAPALAPHNPVVTAVAAQSRSAPSFSLLPYDGGSSVSLTDFENKVVLLYFWVPS